MIGVQTLFLWQANFLAKPRPKRGYQQVVSFDGRPMESWERISIAMVDVIGDQNTVQIGLRPLIPAL